MSGTSDLLLECQRVEEAGRREAGEDTELRELLLATLTARVSGLARRIRALEDELAIDKTSAEEINAERFKLRRWTGAT